MKAIVTAVHADGAQWGWPGEPVYRYLGEDGSWAWVPQLPAKRRTVGDVFDVDDGWEWLEDDERAAALAKHKGMTGRERKARLRTAATRTDIPKTPAQLDCEIAESLAASLARRNK